MGWLDDVGSFIKNTSVPLSGASAIGELFGGGGGGKKKTPAAPKLKEQKGGEVNYDTLLHSLPSDVSNALIKRGHARLSNLPIADKYLPAVNEQGIGLIVDFMLKNPGVQLPSWVMDLVKPEDTKSQAQTAPDPLAMQLFFNSTVAPYLNKIGTETQQATAPLYQMAQHNIQGAAPQYKGILETMLNQQQAGEKDMTAALQGATAAAPSLDALMANVTAARQASLKDYYEQLASKAYGGLAGGMAQDPAIQAALQKITGKST